ACRMISGPPGGFQPTPNTAPEARILNKGLTFCWTAALTEIGQRRCRAGLPAEPLGLPLRAKALTDKGLWFFGVEAARKETGNALAATGFDSTGLEQGTVG